MLLIRARLPVRFAHRLCLSLLCLLAVMPLTPALSAEPSADELDNLFAVRGIVYEQNDGADDSGGNPYIDEDASVQEGIVLLRKRVNDSHAVQAKFTGVIVTAASWDNARLKAETISGATTQDHGRLGWDLGWLYKNSQGFSGSIHATYGTEYTYRTEGVNIAVGQVFNEGSTALGFKLTAYDDRVRNIRFDGQELEQETRETYTTDLSLIQSINTYSHINLSWTHTEQDGFLATSYNAVQAGDAFDYERVPQSRSRDTLSLRYKHALARDSYQLGYGRYWDSWGIGSDVFEGRYYFNLYNGRFSVQTSARYYKQAAADFYGIDFEQPQLLQTSDSDLGRFTGTSAGVLLAFYNPRRMLGFLHTYELGFNYYQRGDGLDLYWLTFGWSFR